MKKKHLESVYTILKSESYLKRLTGIHVHYQNVKCEQRYRDALLEEFTASHRAAGISAYAEVEKVDLAIFDASTHPVRVEFKYQYTYDMAKPVGNELSKLGFAQILANANNRGRRARSVAERIVRDCVDTNCDCFILVVQDRTGHPDEDGLHNGVAANFIEDQRSLDRTYGKGTPENLHAWLTPTQKLFEHMRQEFGGELRQRIEHRVSEHTVPLTSHIFMLDLTARRCTNT